MGRNKKARLEWDQAMKDSGQPTFVSNQKTTKKRTSGIYF